jgi:hypothetical protein
LAISFLLFNLRYSVKRFFHLPPSRVMQPKITDVPKFSVYKLFDRKALPKISKSFTRKHAVDASPKDAGVRRASALVLNLGDEKFLVEAFDDLIGCHCGTVGRQSVPKLYAPTASVASVAFVADLESVSYMESIGGVSPNPTLSASSFVFSYLQHVVSIVEPGHAVFRFGGSAFGAKGKERPAASAAGQHAGVVPVAGEGLTFESSG